MLTNGQVRPQEKETKLLAIGAQMLVSAGIVSTAHVLEVLILCILEGLKILEILRQIIADI